jgi:MFS family permease
MILVGGLLTEHVGWEWIFFVNIPVGIGVGAACARDSSGASGEALRDSRSCWPITSAETSTTHTSGRASARPMARPSKGPAGGVLLTSPMTNEVRKGCG